MGTAIVWKFASLASIIMASGAIYLAVNGLDWWGWFLLCAVLCCVSGSSSSDKKDE